MRHSTSSHVAKQSLTNLFVLVPNTTCQLSPGQSFHYQENMLYVVDQLSGNSSEPLDLYGEDKDILLKDNLILCAGTDPLLCVLLHQQHCE